jgi:hypothetical protein
MMETLHGGYRDYQESLVLMKYIVITQGNFSYHRVTGSFVTIIHKILTGISLAGSEKDQ